MADAMTLAEIRAEVLSEADWAPTQSTAFVADLDRYIWLALKDLTKLTPGLLHDQERVYLQPPAQYASSVATDRLETATGDRLVLERPRTTGRTAWVFDGRWDSRKLTIQAEDGTYYRRVAHEWWADKEADVERVSLDRPYPETTAENLKWWVSTDPYLLRDDVVNVVDARRWEPTTNTWTLMQGIDERVMDRYQMGLGPTGANAASTGSVPLFWARGRRVSLRPPNWTPVVANSGTWDASGDDTGQFDYRLTICWGRRDLDALDPHANLTPTWESPPSPVSAKITATAGAGGAITITTPNIDFITHYAGLPTSSARTFRSGYFIRVYARRYSSTEATPVDELAGYYLLGEVDGTGPFAHTGEQQLVYEVPLRPNQDIPTIRFWPEPQARAEIDLRVVRRPRPFYAASEVVPIPPEASELVIMGARMRLARKQQLFPLAAEIQGEINSKVEAINNALLRDPGKRLRRGMVYPVNTRGVAEYSDLVLYGYTVDEV